MQIVTGVSRMAYLVLEDVNLVKISAGFCVDVEGTEKITSLMISPVKIQERHVSFLMEVIIADVNGGERAGVHFTWKCCQITALNMDVWNRYVECFVRTEVNK